MATRLTISRREAKELCEPVYPTREAALAVARQLRNGGWKVLEIPDGYDAPRPDGTTAIAAGVYHPSSGWSPGDVVYEYVPGKPPAHDPGG